MILSEIRKGEGKNLEFKERLSDKNKESFLKTVVAFANGSGGKIIFGIKDKTREIVGILEDEIFSMMDSITNMIHDKCFPTIIPEIYIENVENKKLLVVEIYPGSQKPYYLKGKTKEVYIRIGATTRKASEEIVRSLERQKFNISYDEEIIYDVSYNEKEIYNLKKDFLNLTGKKLTKSDLYNLKILKNIRQSDYLTVGGALLIGKNNFFDYAKISCARFKGFSLSTKEFIDQKEYSGPLYKQVESAFNFAIEHIEKRGEIKGLKREDSYIVPIEAIREALVNAVVHRDYSFKGSDIKLAIFDDRVEITSPGGLPGNLSVDLILQGRSEIRNRVIARFFKEIGYVEQWGTGIKRIVELCKARNLKEPEFIDDGAFFKVIIYKVPDSAGGVPDSAGGVPDSAGYENKILDFLYKNGKITRVDVEQLFNVKERRARDILKNMVDKGILKRKGKGSKVYYELNKDRDFFIQK
jgi:ATP-dependent DNA helicase RecG